MKEYKENKRICYYKNRYRTCYLFNGICHGFYYFIYSDSTSTKGYFNMDEEYSHWLEYNNEFKYYL